MTNFPDVIIVGFQTTDQPLGITPLETVLAGAQGRGADTHVIQLPQNFPLNEDLRELVCDADGFIFDFFSSDYDSLLSWFIDNAQDLFLSGKLFATLNRLPVSGHETTLKLLNIHILSNLDMAASPGAFYFYDPEEDRKIVEYHLKRLGALMANQIFLAKTHPAGTMELFSLSHVKFSYSS